jgi:hypothetical protein
VRLALPHFATREKDSEAVDVVLAAVAEGLGAAANRRKRAGYPPKPEVQTDPLLALRLR